MSPAYRLALSWLSGRRDSRTRRPNGCRRTRESIPSVKMCVYRLRPRSPGLKALRSRGRIPRLGQLRADLSTATRDCRRPCRPGHRIPIRNRRSINFSHSRVEWLWIQWKGGKVALQTPFRLHRLRRNSSGSAPECGTGSPACRATCPRSTTASARRRSRGSEGSAIRTLRGALTAANLKLLDRACSSIYSARSAGLPVG